MNVEMLQEFFLGKIIYYQNKSCIYALTYVQAQ